MFPAFLAFCPSRDICYISRLSCIAGIPACRIRRLSSLRGSINKPALRNRARYLHLDAPSMSDSSAFPVRPGMAPGFVARVSPTRKLEQGSGTRARVTGPVWSRCLILLLALAAIKVALLIGQSESLYELHWRIGGMRPTWVNDFSLFAFVILGGLSLVRLEKSCRSVGTRTVRVVNAAVLVLGLSFLFLTFHNGDKNFLYPVLSGVLKWTSLCSYSANILFFNEPFLAAWMFVYTIVYYVVARTDREHRVLSLTALFAVAYALINLREFARYRNELLIIDCAAAVSLVITAFWGRVGEDTAKRLSLAWLLLPCAWVFFFGWALLRFDLQWHSNAAKYFLGLAAVTMILCAAATLLVRRCGNPPAWNWFLPFLFLGFFLLADTNYPACSNYSHLLCLAFTFPRYLAQDVGVVVCLAFIAVALCKKWPRAGLWFMDFSAVGLIVLAIVDLRLSQIMGVRLGWDVLAFGDSPTMMFKMARPYLPSLMVGLAVLVTLYAVVLRAIRVWSNRAIEHPQVSNRESIPSPGGPGATYSRTQWNYSRPLAVGLQSPGLVYVLAIFVMLAALGLAIAEPDKVEGQSLVRLVKTTPFWKRVASRRMNEREFMQSASALGLGDFSAPSRSGHSGAQRDLNVLVVFMESSYNKHLSLFGSNEETQPELTRYKDRMELFPNFFSAFTSSIHARFATFTSLYPVLDFHAFTQERVPVKSLFEVLHDHGYSCSMFYSSYFDYTGFRDFLKNRGLEEMYDADTMPGLRSTERVSWGLLEEETLGAIRGQLKKYAASHQRFCLTYVPAAPHYPYDKIPKAFQKHKLAELDDFTPLYLNELLYMDWVIASIIDQLKESGLLDHTLVVITNDHGEMVGGKDGHIGHGWAVTPQLANTPLILMDPARQGFQANTTIGTQVDLLPTVLDRLNIPLPADQLYEGISLDAGPTRDGRFSYLNSYKEFGIIYGDQVLLGDREASSPSGVASSGAVYTITNQGTATVFTLQTEAQQGSESATSETRSDPSPQASTGSPALVQHRSEQVPPAVATSQARKSTMTHFDAFQENLLRNYDFYSRSLRVRALTQAGPPKAPKDGSRF